jgi:hypothetical protein
VVAIAAGLAHSVALKDDGSVVVWGNNDEEQLYVPLSAQSGVVAIAAAEEYVMALKNDGSVVGWGAVLAIPSTVPHTVTAIAGGYGHQVALKTDGSIVVWGNDDQAQLDVPPAAQSNVTAIAAGDLHSVILRSDGSVVAWGPGTNDLGTYPEFGQSLVPPVAQSGVLAIAAGNFHTVAIVTPVVPLTVSRSGNELITSWRSSALGFTLQSTTNLSPPVLWTDVTNAPVVISEHFVVTNAFTGAARYYRLRKP